MVIYKDIEIRIVNEFESYGDKNFIHRTYGFKIDNTEIDFTTVEYAKKSIDNYISAKNLLGKKYRDRVISKIAFDRPNALHSGETNIRFYDQNNEEIREIFTYNGECFIDENNNYKKFVI